jgi:hypothetical protein
VKKINHGGHQHNAAANPQKTNQGADNQAEGQDRTNQHVERASIRFGKKKGRTTAILLRARRNSNLLLAAACESVNISEQSADGFWAGKRN